MDEIKRFECYDEETIWECPGCGDWMLYKDHEKIVEKLKAEVEALKADNITLNNLNLELEEDIRYWMNREMYE